MAAIYTRGLNPPYTEGYIASAHYMTKAIALTGWNVVVLNFRYPTDEPMRSEAPPNHNFEIRIPSPRRDVLIHSQNAALQAGVSSIEFAFFPFLMIRELRRRVSLVHLVNCFKFPRQFIRVLRKTPVINHVYQTHRALSLHLPLDAVVASSKRIALTLKSLRADAPPIFTIPPAVDTDFFRTMMQTDQGRKTVLYIGNLTHDRLPNRFFNIIKEILVSCPDAEFRLIAAVNPVNTSRIREINAICQSLQISDKVHVALRNMRNEEKLREYLRAKLFIFSPLSTQRAAIEPPLAVLEALSSGVPVLATNTCSVAEVLESGRNGFVVNVEDYSRLTERAIDMLRADQDCFRSWSDEARRTAVEGFSIGSVSRKYKAMHSTILESSRISS